jgi:hypothetical protein
MDWCEYRYKFGDLNLDQSCRIRDKNSLIKHYGELKKLYPDIATKGDAQSLDPNDQYSSKLNKLLTYVKENFKQADPIFCRDMAGLTSGITGHFVI